MWKLVSRPPESCSQPMNRTLHLPSSFPLAVLLGAPTIGSHPCSSTWLRARPPWQHSQERALPHRRRQAETGPRRERAGVDLVWTVAGTRSAPSWGRRLSIDAPGSCHTNGAIVATWAVPSTTPMQGGASCYRQHSCDSWRMNAAGCVLRGSSMQPGIAVLSATSEHLSFLCRGDHACRHS